MIRESVLMVLVAMTACGAPEIPNAPARSGSPGKETESSTVRAAPTPDDGQPKPDGAGCYGGFVTDRVRAGNADDPDYWIEALVFGASDSDRFGARDRECTKSTDTATGSGAE